MNTFDVCVIGGGPSGYAAAMRAVDFKKSVLLIERHLIGGAGIHNGALSSKAWWELSREYYSLRRNSERLQFDLPKVAFKRLKKEVSRAMFDRRDLLEYHMRMLNQKGESVITFCHGEARLTSPHDIEVRNSQNEVSTFQAENIILATGSRPRNIPTIPIDEEVILTSDGLHNLKEFPKSMVVVGAGVIGCEFATIFANFGATKIFLIDKGDRILPFEDPDVVEVIEKNLEKKNAVIHRNSRLVNIQVVDGEVEYELEYNTGRREIFYVEKALVSIGRVPNYENLGLEELGVKMDSRGIQDELTQTSVSNIYAVGDITADIALVNIGELEGRYAIERIFGQPNRGLIYDNISTIMFLDPEVAGVGLNETKAQQEGIDYKMASIQYNCIARAVAMRNTVGFIKILVTNDQDMRMLGIRVVGEHASSAIQTAALLISMNKGINELAELIHPHPSIIEGIQECVRMLLNKSTFKLSVMQESMACRTCVGGKIEDILS